MGSQCRYIVWRQGHQEPLGFSIASVLSEFPAVKVLKLKDPDSAVVLMDDATREEVRQRRPELLIERDVQYRIVSAR